MELDSNGLGVVVLLELSSVAVNKLVKMLALSRGGIFAGAGVTPASLARTLLFVIGEIGQFLRLFTISPGFVGGLVPADTEFPVVLVEPQR